MNIERNAPSSYAVQSELADQAHASLAADPGAQVAVLLVESATQSRSQAAESRATEEHRLEGLEEQQIHQMLEAADHTRTAAWERGLGMMAAGTLDVIGSTKGLKAEGDKGKLTADRYAGWGAGIQSGTQLAAACEDSAAKEAEAKSMRAGNQAKHSERQLQDIQQQANQADELLRTALQGASDWARGQNAADQATLYLRG
jgi:hypothetical protein